jgi:hypothetical protein
VGVEAGSRRQETAQRAATGVVKDRGESIRSPDLMIDVSMSVGR